MSDPASAGYLGVKYSVVVAGFAGGVISLAYLREMSQAQMLVAVLAGSACAAYLTPVAIPMLAQAVGIQASPSLENAAAFLLGLCAMNIIPGVLRISELFHKSPSSVIGRKDGQP